MPMTQDTTLQQLMKFVYHFSDIDTVFITPDEDLIWEYSSSKLPQILTDYLKHIKFTLKRNSEHNKTHIGIHNTTYQLQFISAHLYIQSSFIGSIVIGPFLKADPTQMNLEDIIIEHHWPMSILSMLQHYYLSLPLISAEKTNTTVEFLQYLFQQSALFQQTNSGFEQILYPYHKKYLADQSGSLNDTQASIETIETRYASENKLIAAVERGDIQTVRELTFRKKRSRYPIPDRIPNDPLRSRKNLAFVRNTILRKAVERGGVHPLYIDSLSEKFAIQIEKTTSVQELSSLLKQMNIDYCETVNRLSLNSYSYSIRKAIEYIRLHLADELNLEILSSITKKNGFEFSRQFKEETGHSLTEYINQARMQLANQLLDNEKLSITDIAYLVGFNDVNYFIKVFKKQYQTTPLQYRKHKRGQ